jgi:hypothetical protein
MSTSTWLSFLRVLLYGWAIALWKLLELLFQKRPPRKPGEHRPTQSGCVVVDNPAFVRPDPLLYSQRHLMAQGLAVTWDNPDITLFKGGVPVSSSELEPATTYEVRARIWNNSLEAPVIDMPVHLSFLDFGVGTEPIPIASAKVDVGVKGSPDQPAVVSFLWTTPSSPGHYCLQVLLDPVDDVEYLNNLGQENTDVAAAHSPAVFTFTLRNNTKVARRYRFEVDAYQIPALPKCEDLKPGRESRLEHHRRERHPVPAGFDVQISPPTPTLDPETSLLITVSVTPPAGFIGRQPLNVNAFHQQGFAGGVTLTCTKEA